MKTALLILGLLGVCLYISELKIQFNPFNISFEKPFAGLFLLSFVLVVVFAKLDSYTNGYNSGYKRGKLEGELKGLISARNILTKNKQKKENE